MHAMLSVLTVDEVEKRIREVPGVESATANHAEGSATVRYDETPQATAPFMEPTIFREVCHD